MFPLKYDFCHSVLYSRTAYWVKYFDAKKKAHYEWAFLYARKAKFLANHNLNLT